MLTGLNLGKDCWFMFQVRNTIQARRDVFVASGDLIGPDSCGYHAEITWQEERGVPSCATWTGLPVPDFVSHYGRVRPKTVPLRGLPFRVEWRQWWESHLPDFFIEITFTDKPHRGIERSLEAAFRKLNPGYMSLRRTGSRISSHPLI